MLEKMSVTVLLWPIDKKRGKHEQITPSSKLTSATISRVFVFQLMGSCLAMNSSMLHFRLNSSPREVVRNEFHNNHNAVINQKKAAGNIIQKQS